MNHAQSFRLAEKPAFFQRAFLKLMGSTIPTGGEVAPGVTRFVDGYSMACAVAVGDGKFILFDTGADPAAKEIIGFLASHDATPADVSAIFVTHGHPDHIASLKNFPDADIYVSPLDRGVLEGTAACEGFLPGLAGIPKAPAVAAVSQLQDSTDGQEIRIGDKKVTAFSLPGHTRGSMAYLVGDALFVGDALTFGKNKALKPRAPLSYDSTLAVESLRKLVARFDAQGIEPKVIIPAHSGEGTLQVVRKLLQ